MNLIHVGGELLTCDAWEATVMLSRPDHAQEAIASLAAWTQDDDIYQICQSMPGAAAQTMAAVLELAASAKISPRARNLTWPGVHIPAKTEPPKLTARVQNVHTTAADCTEPSGDESHRMCRLAKRPARRDGLR